MTPASGASAEGAELRRRTPERVVMATGAVGGNGDGAEARLGPAVAGSGPAGGRRSAPPAPPAHLGFFGDRRASAAFPVATTTWPPGPVDYNALGVGVLGQL